MELKCSYLTALIFLSFDRISISFLVGNMATSRISLTNSIHPRMDCMGDLNVSTSVSWSSMLKTTGNIFPGCNRWLARLVLVICSSPFSFKYYDCILMDKSKRSFYFTWTMTQIDIVSCANCIRTILCKLGQEKGIRWMAGKLVNMGQIFIKENYSMKW